MDTGMSDRCGVLALAIFLAGAAMAGTEEGASYSPTVRDPLPQLYWGDTHLHTALSADAHTMETRLSADEAYRLARGEQVTADNGMAVRLRRPLDFLAVSDHAEYLGVYTALENNDQRLASWPLGRRWLAHRQAGNSGMPDGLKFGQVVQSQAQEFHVPDALRASVWRDAAGVADRYNEPGLFTAFVAYEWTSMVTGDNLHRVVLYRDGAALAGEELPFTAQHSTDPEDLWAALASYEQRTGGQVLAIAHNGNVSNGRMFAPTRLSGEPMDSDYASRRARWEPVYEVTQLKGDGETHPALSPEDEFADFETWDRGNILLSRDKEPWMLPYEYARSALREGLRHEADLGVNPFKFGLIGSTDSHTGLSTADEDNFFGKFALDEPSPDRLHKKMAHVLQENWELGASGLAAVWARDNTREALFDAIRRREVYATTGPRIQVRFFGGWDFKPGDELRGDYAVQAYRKGVPMGSDLVRAEGREAPTFLVAAARDPEGANLDRVQIIKGWLDAAGETHETIHDVALSDGRHVDPESGEVEPVGNTVDVVAASYTNTIGAPELAVVWRDPDFDPEQRAFYYVRVLEIPTPRWTTYDARFFGTALAEHIPRVVQDRAYTSPIWYTP